MGKVEIVNCVWVKEGKEIFKIVFENFFLKDIFFDFLGYCVSDCILKIR